jgi:hypothetical protein
MNKTVRGREPSEQFMQILPTRITGRCIRRVG